MTRIAPRARARKKSVDFSRLGWLIATEAAFQVLAHPRSIFTQRERRYLLGRAPPRRLERLRAHARARLGLAQETP